AGRNQVGYTCRHRRSWCGGEVDASPNGRGSQLACAFLCPFGAASKDETRSTGSARPRVRPRCTRGYSPTPLRGGAQSGRMYVQAPAIPVWRGSGCVVRRMRVAGGYGRPKGDSFLLRRGFGRAFAERAALANGVGRTERM